MPKEASVHAEYVGKDGAYIDGVPARDLSKKEWSALSKDLQEVAIAAGTHKIASGTKRKPSVTEEDSNG